MPKNASKPYRIKRFDFGKQDFSPYSTMRYNRKEGNYLPLKRRGKAVSFYASDYYYKVGFKIKPLFYSPRGTDVGFVKFRETDRGREYRDFLFDIDTEGIYDWESNKYRINYPRSTYINLLFNPEHDYKWRNGVSSKPETISYAFSRYKDWMDENRYLRLLVMMYFVYSDTPESQAGFMRMGYENIIYEAGIWFSIGGKVNDILKDKDFSKKVFALCDFWATKILNIDYKLIGVHIQRIDVGYKARHDGFTPAEMRRIKSLIAEKDGHTHREVRETLGRIL